MKFFNPFCFDPFASSGGSGTAKLISKLIKTNGVYNASSDNVDGYSEVTIDVDNTYVAEDEGKVVSNGALVAQGSITVADNGTIDTTLYSSVVINVPQVLPDNALTPIFTNNVQVITGNVEEV